MPFRSEALIVVTEEGTRSDLEPLQQEPEQKRSDADPRHAKVGELTKRESSRTVEDIGRAESYVFANGRGVKQKDRVDAISSRFEIFPGTLQAFLDGTLVIVHVDTSIDYRVEATGTRSSLDGGNTFRLYVGVNESADSMVSVFEVCPAGTRIDEAINEFLC